MVRFENISKTCLVRKFAKLNVFDLNLMPQTDELINMIGADDTGKSALPCPRCVIKQSIPGKATHMMSMSCYIRMFLPCLTVADKIPFITCFHNLTESQRPTDSDDFSQLGFYLNRPANIDSGSISARFVFVISRIVVFDYYPMNEIPAAGDHRFLARTPDETKRSREMHLADDDVA